MLDPYFNHPAISNSDLGLFIQSPKYFQFCKENNVKKETDSLSFGNYLHTLCLEPNEVKGRYIEADFEKVGGNMGIFIETLASFEKDTEYARKVAYLKSGFKWTAEKVYENFNKDIINLNYYKSLQESIGKEIISSKDVEKAKRCKISLRSDHSINKLLFESESLFDKPIEVFNEVAIFFDVNNLRCKSKIDRLIVCPKLEQVIEIDIKTYSRNFITNYKNYDYERQRAFYKEAIKSFCFENYFFIPKDENISSFIAAINVEAPYEADLYKIDQYDLTKCWDHRILPKLKDLKECLLSKQYVKKYKKVSDFQKLSYITLENERYK